MDKYFQILGSGNIGIYVGIGLVVVVFLMAVVRGIMKTKTKVEEPDLPRTTQKAKEAEGQTEETEEKPKTVLGTGEYKCMCFCPGNVLDFTTIPEPIGEVYQFDGSLPVSGSAYIVLQRENGEVVDYDPRDVEFVLKQSPEYLWLATHPQKITKQFWAAPIQWWRSTSTWFAAGMIAVTFICALVVYE